jgi:4-hydroxybenzoate polyprenyltransferase
MIMDLIKSARPKQWYKNIVVFAGLVFSFNLFDISMLLKTVLAVAMFCLISSTVYIFNDIHDKEKDKKHPKKKFRPIPSGRISVRLAGLIGISMLVVGLFLSYYLLNMMFFIIVLAYFVLIDLYTYWLKNMAVVDVMIISIGFVLRAIAGVVAIGVILSPWLILCTFLLAMILAFGKRKQEIAMHGKKSKDQRQSLQLYSAEMIDNFIAISAALIIMSYSLYTFLAANSWMMVTIPFVIFAVLKYMQLLDLKILGEETEMMFKNKSMMINIIIWVIVSVLILYFNAPSLIFGELILL